MKPTTIASLQKCKRTKRFATIAYDYMAAQRLFAASDEGLT